MALLDFGPLDPQFTLLSEGGVYLRPPERNDYEPWVQARAASRAHLQPWEPEWASDEFSREAWRRRMRYYANELRSGSGRTFFIFRASDDALVGGATLSNMRRGASQAAEIGYWIAQSHTRKGYGSLAAGLVVAHGLEVLGLHRIEAACMPSNVASRRILTGLGFRREGLARDYLRIAGRWRDHLVFSKLAKD